MYRFDREYQLKERHQMDRKKPLIAATLAAAALLLTGCSSDADNADYNISQKAEQFEIQRKIVFYNGITDTYVATVEGRCSIERDAEKMYAVCKVGPNEYTRDEVGLSDNVTYFALQMAPIDVSVYHKEIVLKPENVLPEFNFEAGEQ